jgi:prophage regulatory protein
MRVLKIDSVAARVSFHPVHIRRLVRDKKFPAPIRLGENRVAWIESEIDAWLVSKREDRDALLEVKPQKHDDEYNLENSGWDSTS